MREYFQKNKIVIILGSVILLGIFLRVYQHGDYLRFNPDQARDAILTRAVLSGEKDWPLLGPQAGGTDFKLGPFFYEMQILAGKFFGTSPENLAFPDLFFSILTIPFLYFFLRAYFSRKISISAVFVFAVSFYAIKYARFAWNPNSMPFFVLLFLYSLHKLTNQKERKKWLWAVLLGATMGVGVQLHSLLLFSFPIVFVLYFIYLFWKKNRAWQFAPLILLVALIFNAPQIISEFQTGGKNLQAFTKGLENKSSRGGSLPYKFNLNSVCHIQTNSFMLLPIGNNNECDFIFARENFSKNKLLLLHLIFAGIFSLGGYFLLFRYWRKEKNERKKIFLGLILLYSGTLFVILIPLAAEISLRFFLVLEFMPFLLLGFWLKFLGEKLPAHKSKIMTVMVVFLVSVNLLAVKKQFYYLEGKAREGVNGFEEITLGEVKFMAEFILKHSDGAEKIYLDGKSSELFKIVKPIKYFATEAGLTVKEFKKDDLLQKDDKLFLVDIIKNPQSPAELSENNQENYDILEEAKYRRVKIYELKEK